MVEEARRRYAPPQVQLQAEAPTAPDVHPTEGRETEMTYRLSELDLDGDDNCSQVSADEPFPAEDDDLSQQAQEFGLLNSLHNRELLIQVN